MTSVGITISDGDKCISFLCSLPDSWDSLVIAVGSNATKLNFDDVVASLLSEEMRRKSMDSSTKDALSVRGHTVDRSKNKSSGGRSKSRGRSKSPGPSVRKCWKCGKTGHYKKDCKSKSFDKNKGSNDTPSTDGKYSIEEGGDVYLASSSTHAENDSWLIDLGASFHMTPHGEWFYEYEKYDGGDVFLEDNSVARIIGRGKIKLLLKNGRIRTLPGVLHIPKLARNLISVSRMDDAGVKTVFEKNTCKMVRGSMVLMRGVWIGTLYKLLGSTFNKGCNITIVPEGINEGDRVLTISREKTMLWHRRLGHIGEKGLRLLQGKSMAEGMSDYTLDFDFCEHCLYRK